MLKTKLETRQDVLAAFRPFELLSQQAGNIQTINILAELVERITRIEECIKIDQYYLNKDK